MPYHLGLMPIARTLILAFSSFFLAATSSAQERAFDCPGGKELSASAGKEIVEKVQKAYADVKGLKAQFVQASFIQALEVSEGSQGEVWFRKPGLMKWVYSDPEVQTFLVRDDTLWFYQQREQQVLVDQFKDVLISDLPVSFLMGIGDLSKDFSLQKACSGPEGTVLEFEPKGGQPQDEEKRLQSFRLLVGSNYMPSGARVSDAGGNTTAILLRKVDVNPAIPDETFAPDFPKGIDVIDRRTKP